MRKTLKKLAALSLSVAIMGSTVAVPYSTKAAEGKDIEWKGYTLATYDDQGRMVYHSTGSAYYDSRGIEYLLNNDKKKTLIIPEGTTITIDQVVDIGNNTTIIATGATIIQQSNGKGALKHIVDGGNYNAIKNVTIIGGKWKNKVNSKACTMLRFAHGSNLKFQGVNIETNYKGHGLELIACKDVLVDKCKIVATNNKTKGKNIREEALQIDIATPKTAPGVLKESGKKAYVKGQTCKNITVTNCTVKSSRGICVSFPGKEQNTGLINKFHRNITIKGCNVIGTNAEAISMFNAVGCTVENNVAKTYCKLKKQPYSDAIHLILMGKNKISTKYTNKIANNVAYGNYYGIEVTSKRGCKYGKTTVSKNKIYSKQGKKRCLSVKYCKKAVTKSNKMAKWK